VPKTNRSETTVGGTHERHPRGWVRNPLTIIGIFAGVSEVAGTVVLPQIGHDLQATFIWFVIGFPVLLVAVFFLTLNLNPRCLYAPSDYRDEEIFSAMMGLPRATASERATEALTAQEAVPGQEAPRQSTEGEKKDG